MGPEDETFASSVSTTATSTFYASATSFGTSFGAASRESRLLDSREGEKLLQHLGQNKWPPEIQQLRAGTAEPRLNNRNAASQPHLSTHQMRTHAYRKSPEPGDPTEISGDDLRVAQVGQLRHTPLPMRHEYAKGRATDRGYAP